MLWQHPEEEDSWLGSWRRHPLKNAEGEEVGTLITQFYGEEGSAFIYRGSVSREEHCKGLSEYLTGPAWKNEDDPMPSMTGYDRENLLAVAVRPDIATVLPT